MRWKRYGLRQKQGRMHSKLLVITDRMEGFQQLESLSESLSTQSVDKLWIVLLMTHKSNILTSDFCQMPIF